MAGFFNFKYQTMSYLANRFLETTPGISGPKQNRGISKPSMMTKAKAQAGKIFNNAAIQSNNAIGVVASNELLNRLPELQKYVMQRGETPSKNPVRLCLQAIFLRADEIARISDTLRMSDDICNREIENAESQEIEDNTGNAEFIMSAPAQAAVDYFTKHISQREKDNGYDGQMSTFLNRFRDPSVFSAETISGVFLPIGSKSPGGTNEGNVSYPDNLFGAGDFQYPDDTPAPSTNPTTTAKEKTNFEKIIDSIMTGIGAVGSIVDKVKDTSTGVIGGIKGTASDIGAESIDKVIKKYLPTIMLVLGAIVVLIIIIYAAKRK